MRNSTESVHGDGFRGTGRTYRQLASLLEGDVFLVHSASMMRYARAMLHDKFGNKRVNIIVCDAQFERSRPHERLRGLSHSHWIEVDHYLVEMLGSGTMRWIQAHNERVPANA